MSELTLEEKKQEIIDSAIKERYEEAVHIRGCFKPLIDSAGWKEFVKQSDSTLKSLLDTLLSQPAGLDQAFASERQKGIMEGYRLAINLPQALLDASAVVVEAANNYSKEQKE